MGYSRWLSLLVSNLFEQRSFKTGCFVHTLDLIETELTISQHVNTSGRRSWCYSTVTVHATTLLIVNTCALCTLLTHFWSTDGVKSFSKRGRSPLGLLNSRAVQCMAIDWLLPFTFDCCRVVDERQRKHKRLRWRKIHMQLDGWWKEKHLRRYKSRKSEQVRIEGFTKE